MDRLNRIKIKVLQLQYRLKSSGDFARRFHEQFRRAGIESSLLTLTSNIAKLDHASVLGRKERIVARIDTSIQQFLTHGIDAEKGKFSIPILGSDISRHVLVKQTDVILVHWVLNGFLSMRSLEQLARLGKPIIFVLHDMWLLTGGCHYSFDCKQYLNGCRQCPLFDNSGLAQVASKSFRRKRSFLNRYHNLYFVAPSRWLADVARQSGISTNIPVHHIPNPLSREIFKPGNKSAARQILNIGIGRTVLAFGAVCTGSPYKGWNYLLRALRILSTQRDGRNYTLLVFGQLSNEQIPNDMNLQIVHVGQIYQEFTAATVYNAADVFVAPSVADNLPYTIFESLACGTAVVSFKTGGITDLIDHKKNGYLAKYRDSDDLVRGIDYCVDNHVRGYLSPDFDNSVNVKKYQNLIEKALELDFGENEINFNASQQAKTLTQIPTQK